MQQEERCMAHKPTGTLLGVLSHLGQVSAVAWSPDGRLASASWDGTMRIWSAVNGMVLADLSRKDTLVKALAWSPDGRLLADASEDDSGDEDEDGDDDGEEEGEDD